MRRIAFFILSLLISTEASSQLWDSLSSGLNRPPRVAYADTVTDKLYVGGTFTSVGGKNIWGIASWDGTSWDSLGSGIDQYPSGPFPPREPWAITRFGSYLYVSGGFSHAGTIFTNAIARWDGTVWDSVPGTRFPAATVVSDMTVYNNELYICGSFDSVGNVLANSIAKWDGVTWSAIGQNYPFDSLTGTVTCLQFYHGTLYVGGYFIDPTGSSCKFAKWDGTSWEFLCSEMLGGTAGIFDMAVYNDELIVGGRFYQADGHPGNTIKKWNDTVWTDVGGSVQHVSANPTITDLTVHNGKLFCAGTFEKIGGVEAMGLAAWDGAQWCSFGSDFEYASQVVTGVQFVEFLNDTMIVGGAFRLVDGDSCTRIAKWTGGPFVDTCGTATGISEPSLSTTDIVVFPNPVTDECTVTLPEGNTAAASLIVFDALGQVVDSRIIAPLQSSLSLNTSAWTNGVYIVRYISEHGFSQKKIIVQH